MARPIDIAPAEQAPEHAASAPRWRLARVADLAELAEAYGSEVSEAIAETLWPTRCAVCDEPGEVLCEKCRLGLPYLDWWRACPRCGAPFGRVQCTECNAIVMGARGLDEPPYAGCASAAVFDDETTGRVVRTWKDAGERRLGAVMADAMAQAIPPAWRRRCRVVAPVPATTRALRRRGFDHALELAQGISERLEMPCAELLARPRSVDQRKLSGSQRLENMAGRFRALPGANVAPAVLLVDDVYTTGATLFAATDALRAAGAEEVYCLTFARVF